MPDPLSAVGRWQFPTVRHSCALLFIPHNIVKVRNLDPKSKTLGHFFLGISCQAYNLAGFLFHLWYMLITWLYFAVSLFVDI